MVLAQWSAWWELVTLVGWRGHEGVWEVLQFLEGDLSSLCPLPEQTEPFVPDAHQMAQDAKMTCLAAAAALLLSLYSWACFVVSLEASLK